MDTNTIQSGVWPTMVTPFTEDGKIDYVSLGRLVEWYIDAGVTGLFAVCLSSEMFKLSATERYDLARATVEAAGGKVPVVCSGHISDSLSDQITELTAMASTGVMGVVLVTNRLAAAGAPPKAAIESAAALAEALPAEITLGLYECPFPYKRLASDDFLAWCRDSTRFTFLKDTCCSIELIKQRLKTLDGSSLKLFNANAATLLDSIKCGGSGYSGVMANFHPSLYVDLWKAAASNPEKAARLSDFVGAMSLIEAKAYPLSAKVYLKNIGIVASSHSRTVSQDRIDPSAVQALEQLFRMTEDFKRSVND